jgi:hypothetical protein
MAWRRGIGSSVLNEFHFGYNRIHSRRAPPDGTPGMKELGVRLPLYPTLASIGEIRVQDFFNIGDNLEASFVRNGFEFSNRTSWVTGRHNIQFGAEVQYYKVDIENEFRRAGHYIFNGSVTGSAMADFFLGRLIHVRPRNRRVQEQPRALPFRFLPGRLQAESSAHAEPRRALRTDTSLARAGRAHPALHDRRL